MRLDQSTSQLMMGRRSFTLQDAQKGHGSHPPSPGAQDAPFRRQGLQRAKMRRRTLWELLHDARTKLTGFFSILI
jgi:hypothetical protein